MKTGAWQGTALRAALILWATSLFLSVACEQKNQSECQTDSDCPLGEACLNDQCFSGKQEEVDAGTSEKEDGGETNSDEFQTPADEEQTTVEGEEIVQADWGSGSGQAGRVEREEGNSEGPMSFALGADAKVYLLDQSNERVLVFADHNLVASIAIPGSTFDDIDVDGSGRILLLDRLVGKKVVLLNADGSLQGEAGLAGSGIPETGGVSAVFFHADGAWVEYDSRYLVRVAGPDGKPDLERPVVSGRFSRDGSTLLSASLMGEFTFNLQSLPVASATGGISTEVLFELPVVNLSLLASDELDRVFLGAHLIREDVQEPFDVLEERIEIVVLGNDLVTEQNRISLPVATTDLELFRSLRVAANGDIYLLAFDDTGVSVRRYGS